MNKGDKYKVMILGTEYTINICGSDDKDLEGAFGACLHDVPVIKILDLKEYEEYQNTSSEVIEFRIKETIRHEVIHAFLNESGLKGNSNDCNSWSRNEEMIDWFAIQLPKIFKVFKELDVL